MKKNSDTFGSTSTPKRVAFIYDGTTYGGVETYILTLLRHLDLTRYEPVVIISGYNYHFCPPAFQEQVKALGIPLLTSLKPCHSRSLSFVKDVNDLRCLFKSAKIDLVHIQTSRFDGGRRATIGARLAGVPSVIRTEHVPPSSNIYPLSKYIIKLSDFLTNYIVVDSNSNRAEQIKLLHRAPQKVGRYYCGIDLARFVPTQTVDVAKERIGLDPALPVVGAVGRMVEQKGHTYLVGAAAQIIKEFGPVNFLLVGNGPLEADLKAQVRALNLEQYFHFVGFQSKYLPYVEAMDITVMPSVYEGFSVSMLEFMAMGKPSVFTNHPSFLEAVVDGESALVVAMRDSEAMAAGILKLLRDPALAARLGHAALARVTQEFSIQRLASDMRRLFDNMLGLPVVERKENPQSQINNLLPRNPS